LFWWLNSGIFEAAKQNKKVSDFEPRYKRQRSSIASKGKQQLNYFMESNSNQSPNDSKTEPFLASSSTSNSVSGSTMSSNNNTASSHYERKLARQRQLEQMEAAASGVAPSMELPIEDHESISSQASSGLRSRNDATRRFLQDEEEQKPVSAGILKQPMTARMQHMPSQQQQQQQPSTGNLFDLRGRNDGIQRNPTGLNLMDHTTGLYREQTRTEQFMASLRSIFSSTDASLPPNLMPHSAAEGDYLDYHRPAKRQSTCAAYCRSLCADRKRRTILLLLLLAAIFIVLVTLKTIQVTVEPKILRQQNNARFSTAMDEIVAKGISSADAFSDLTSPEYHALRWVSYSDPTRLAVDHEMFLTRYALAVFFYSSYLTFEASAGRQKPIETGTKQWEGVPNPGWTRKDYWMTEKGVCQWYGVHCSPKRVTNPTTGAKMLITQYDKDEAPLAIQLKQNHIVGTLPGEFKALDQLKMIDFTANKLTGSFPTHLGSLFHLEFLHLPDNLMTGSIPSEIGSMEGLKTLDLRHNALVGMLPTEMNRLYNLEGLYLSYNKLTGKVPDLSKCQGLKKIYIDNNMLNDRFAFSLALQKNAIEIHLNDNQIIGTIPGEILSIRELEIIRLENNKIAGQLPHGMFDRMSHLREVSVDNNLMTGTIPSENGAMVQLALLSLSNNRFEGPLPDSWGRVQTLKQLHLNDNKINGTLPASLGNITNIEEIWMQDNALVGPIPVSLSLAWNLTQVLLENNKLTGTIPIALGAMKGLKTLRLEQNNLEGDMPYTVCDLKSTHNLGFISADCKSKIDCQKDCCNECH
jgi:Leucine-rich repeat (LRR) protein